MSRRRSLLLALVVTAFAVRLAFFLAEPNPAESAGLVASHGEVARNIVVHGEWFAANRSAGGIPRKDGRPRSELTDPADLDFAAADARPRFEPVAIEMPGAAVVLAALWQLTGDHDYGYLQLLQALLDALGVLLVYWCSLKLFGRPRAALLAAGAYAVFLPVAALMRIAHLDSWAAILTLAMVALFLRVREAERPVPWLLGLGLLTGVGAYFRPSLVILPLFLGIALFLAGERRRGVSAALVPTLISLLLLVPWAVRNYEEYGEFVPTRVGVGQTLWEGLGEIPNDFGAILDDQRTFEQVRRVRPELRYGTPAYDNYLREKAVDAIGEHPGHWLKVIARRIVYSTVLLRNFNWVGEPYNRSGGLISFMVQQPVNFVRAVAGQLLEPVLFLFAMAVVALTWRRFRTQYLLLLAVPLATMLPYIALHFEARYLIPAELAYLIIAALGADLLLERRSRAAANSPP